MDDPDHSQWHELITLLTQDVTNILSTCLSAPPTFPLPVTAMEIVRNASDVLAIIEHSATMLVKRNDPARAWNVLVYEVARL